MEGESCWLDLWLFWLLSWLGFREFKAVIGGLNEERVNDEKSEVIMLGEYTLHRRRRINWR